MKRWLQGIAALLIALIGLALARTSKGLSRMAAVLANAAASCDRTVRRLERAQ